MTTTTTKLTKSSPTRKHLRLARKKTSKQKRTNAPRATCDEADGPRPYQDVLDRLPAEALPPADVNRARKSYTLTQEGKDAKISIILNTQSFYIYPLKCVPEVDGVPIVTNNINQQGGLSMSFKKRDASECWDLAKRVSSWC